MWTDVVALRTYYESTPGQVSGRLLRGSVRACWPDVTNARVAGLGYAAPVLRAFQGEAERLSVLLPAGMGAVRWPAREPCLSALVDEQDLPLPDRSVDRLLLIHCLEFSHHPREVLRECWRVLTDQGRLMVIVPNRAGLWARLERSPFAMGQPYSPTQLSRLLHDTLFAPIRSTTALFLPPVESRVLLGSASAVERLGARWCAGFGGVVVAEAAKEFAAPVLRAHAARRVRLALPQALRGPSVTGPATRERDP
ncbi:class I SAM-dependent methyltransferase [Pararhodospirillum oryzae]|uniref:Methyltransferase type 11 n=1 Tax=Pararhodospirillum oryzae TaxID=478448 RepID=A0A512HA55_9PROT|nr:methyltransferase domain-containing protein [Pararhodospirillum oryzae]GEO82319.1 methyltransferase type 11 [Pararhodospirillum oryzae]